MNDDNLITELETKVEKRWKEIKESYSEWVFGKISETNIEKNR